MPYFKTPWKNKQTPALNDTNLNKIEAALETAITTIENHIIDGTNPHGVTDIQVNADLASISATQIDVQTNANQVAADTITVTNIGNQVAADKITTQSHVDQTTLDRAATAADVISTNADRIQTGLDRTAVASDKADVTTLKRNVDDVLYQVTEDRVVTLAARDLAEDWASNPEDIQVLLGEYSAKHWSIKAETFASDIEQKVDEAKAWATNPIDTEVTTGLYSAFHHATKASADADQTTLDRIATNADAIQTAEDRIQTGHDAQATANDRIQTGLDAQSTNNDAIQTNLDRIQTGNDVLTAQAARDKAEAWADNPEDIPVELDRYSAFHWAIKAEDLAQSLVTHEATYNHPSYDTHLGNTENPHSVTFTQVGAEPANANIQTHIASTSNPHGTTVTKLTDTTIATPETYQSLLYTGAGWENQHHPLGPDIQRIGFLNQDETTIFFNDTAAAVANNGTSVPAYSFQLGDAGTGWSYYMQGVRYDQTGNRTVTLPGVPPAAATYFITIQNNTTGTLSASTTVWDLSDDTTALVAVVRYNSAMTPTYWLGEERHTVKIDRREHYYNHTTKGTQATLVGEPAGYTIDVDTVAAKTFSVGPCTIFDEDIKQELAILPDPNGAADYVVFYRNSPSTWVWQSSIMPFPYAAAGYIQYDNNGVLTEGSQSKWFNSYLILSNYQGAARYIFVPGRAQFDSLADAQAEDATQFDWVGLGIVEYVIAYQFTWRSLNAFTSAGKVVLDVEPKRLNISTTSAAAVTTNSHNALSGLQGGTINEYYHLTATDHSDTLAHIVSISNPHLVTKAQVGLGDVDNVSAASLRDRSTHTGTQAIATVSGLQIALDSKANDADISIVGKTGSYNDLLNKPDLSVLEEVLVYDNISLFPATGETGKVYIATDTGYMYRWSGTSYVQLTDQTAIWGQISGTLSSQTDLQTALNGKEPAFSKNSAFNKNFGSVAGTVAEGDDSRLSDARTPITHDNTYHSVNYTNTRLRGSSGGTYTSGDVTVTGSGAATVFQVGQTITVDVATGATYTAGNGLTLTTNVFALGTPSTLTTVTTNATTATSHTHAVTFPVTSVNGQTGGVSLSASDVGAATSTHTHGAISNTGTVSTAATVASTDRILITDASASNAVRQGPTFGTGTTTYLRNDGAWGAPPNTTYSAGNGIALSSTTFSVAGGNGLTQEASGLAMGTPSSLDSSTTNATTATSHTHEITGIAGGTF